MANKPPGKTGANGQSPAPSGATGAFTSVRAAILVAIVAIGIGAAYFISGNSVTQTEPAPAPASPPPTATAETGAPPRTPEAQQSIEPPPSVALKPHPQANLPPLPFGTGAPARPIEVVRAVHRFAAEHPEVLTYVPCYCGCEHQGHRGNEDCFVTARDAKGDVQEWEPHGMT